MGARKTYPALKTVRGIGSAKFSNPLIIIFFCFLCFFISSFVCDIPISDDVPVESGCCGSQWSFSLVTSTWNDRWRGLLGRYVLTSITLLVLQGVGTFLLGSLHQMSLPGRWAVLTLVSDAERRLRGPHRSFKWYVQTRYENTHFPSQ